MEQLETERQELAACINSVKALTLPEQSAHAKAAAQQLVQQEQEQQRQQQEQQQQEQREQQQVGRVGASRAAGLRTAAVQGVAAVTAAVGAASAKVKEEQPGNHAVANGWMTTNAAVQPAVNQDPAAAAAAGTGYYTSLLQQALQTAADPRPPPAVNCVTQGSSTQYHVNSGSSGSCSSSIANGASSYSASSLRYMRGTCKDMVADMDSRLLKWRTLSGARSAVTFVLRSDQIAAMLLAALPYMPMMGCMCDYVPAARAAALKREQQQQQQQQPAQQQH
jgi:hypothetical protein